MSINWGQVFSAVLAAFFSHSLSVRLGNGTLTASVNGTAVHVTAEAILAAAAMAFEGQAASIQVGSVEVTFTPNPTS
jgi:hypothetical protein